MRRNLPPHDLFIGKVFSRYPDYQICEYVNSGSNGHLFRAYNSSTENDLAFKIVPVENLPDDDGEQLAYLDEARKANQLDHPAVVKCITVFSPDDDIPVTCVVFVYNFIEGRNLYDHIKDHKDEIDIPFVESFLRIMFELLFELQQLNITHGDLHAGNILVASPKYDIYNRPVFRVTDFGVRELTGHPPFVNDYMNVANILKLLLQNVEYGKCEGRDRYVFNVFNQEFLARHLIETDTSADQYACNPRRLLEKLDSVDDRYSTANYDRESTLNSPFDFPNCEQIGNSHLLLKNLYSDRLLGLPEIHKRSNLVVTGPRGCGKTTVFRALSLEYLTSTYTDDPEEMSYVGFYYRCDDLYFAFPRYRTPERAEALDVPMHFLTVTLIAIALDQVSRWASKHFADEFGKKEERLTQGLWEIFGWNAPHNPSANRLPTFIQRLNKERMRAATKQRFVNVTGEPIVGYFGPDKLFNVCHLLRTRLSFLHSRHIFFFIDDYSHPKITKELQANLNRMVMHRDPDVFFKLSTESPVSFAREDIDGKRYVESREFDLLNLGLRYISSSSEQSLMFLEDLFARRFNQVNDYPVKTLQELVGSMPRNENESARDFRQRRGRNNYAGKETIAAMCSGDIHYVIRLVSNMVEDYGGQPAITESETEPRIPAVKQHASICTVAGTFMESVRTLPQHGQQLADIVTSFGNVARSFLLYQDSVNQTGHPPHQASRIEPYEPLFLSSEAYGILEELIRYSIFIEDPRGKSRRNKVVPRFYLRRYLIPHFRLTFSRRDSLEMENSDIEQLLLDPKKFENRWRLKSMDDAKHRHRRNPRQQELLLNDDES